MQQRVITVFLLTGLFFSLITLCSGIWTWRLPDNQQGYAPLQPINYSHRIHAGELKIDCKFCHSGSDQSRHAGIPSTDVCMKCHLHVTNSFDLIQAHNKVSKEKLKPAPELQKLYDFAGVDAEMKPKKDATPKAIPWVRVHNLPDYVYFDHSAHVVAGVKCQKCHGPVETMQRVRQFESLSMGWCINCHRESTNHGVNGKAVHASTNCTTCHY